MVLSTNIYLLIILLLSSSGASNHTSLPCRHFWMQVVKFSGRRSRSLHRLFQSKKSFWFGPTSSTDWQNEGHWITHSYCQMDCKLFDRQNPTNRSEWFFLFIVASHIRRPPGVGIMTLAFSDLYQWLCKHHTQWWQWCYSLCWWPLTFPCNTEPWRLRQVTRGHQWISSLGHYQFIDFQCN